MTDRQMPKEIWADNNDHQQYETFDPKMEEGFTKYIRADLAVSEPEWRAIAEAPRDETRVLLMGGKYYLEASGHEHQGQIDKPVIGWFWNNEWRVENSTYAEYALNPTHWMPLPSPPSDDKK